MEELTIDPSLLNAAMEASFSTYLTHLRSDKEVYALGCLESTANLVYILSLDHSLSTSHGIDNLANKAQFFAAFSLERFSGRADSITNTAAPNTQLAVLGQSMPTVSLERLISTRG